jgi:hypothetical protein
MTMTTGLTLPDDATTTRAQRISEVTTVLLLLCLGLLGIAVGLTLAMLFPTWADVATLS